jgi:hypothetical protein
MQLLRVREKKVLLLVIINKISKKTGVVTTIYIWAEETTKTIQLSNMMI